MKRLTDTNKWKDTFFLKLKPIEKLIFLYLCDSCNDAGFLDLNYNSIANEVGVNKENVILSIKNIEKTFLISDDSERIWIKKFLLHQNKLPLDLKTSEGNFIKFEIENNQNKFKYPNEFEVILKNIKKKTRSKIGEFIKPTLDDVINNFKDGEWSYITREEIEGLYDYYESVGWKVGNKKMADYKKAFINCFRRNMHRYPRPNTNGRATQKQNTQQTRMDMIAEGNEKIAGFDYNTLKKS